MNKKDQHKKSGFTSPKHYFERFDDRLFDRLNNDQEHTLGSKESGFVTPESYFDTFESSLSDSIRLAEQSTITATTGFKVPENYFEELEDVIYDQIEVKKESVKVINLFSRKQLLYVASIAAVVVLGLFVFNTNDNLTDPDVNLALIEEYITSDDYVADLIDTSMLFELAEDTIVEESLSNEEKQLLNYLSDDITIDDIFEDNL